MIYTHKTPWTLFLGLAMLGHGALVHSGAFATVIDVLDTSKHAGEMPLLSYAFGALALLAGLRQLHADPRPGTLDYYGSMVGGLAFILVIAFAVKWYFDPLMAVWGKGAEPALGFDFAKVMNLNYVVLGILAGIVVRNSVGVPACAENGIRLSRLGLKSGVIMLGALYSWAELREYGAMSVLLISVFVLGSVGLVLWLGARMGISNSMAGVLSAGLGVCGVSATVASAPVVNAKSTEIAYTIGTILLWGVLCMFIFPIVGKWLGLSYTQFGAWAGTGILNSAQVAGAALAFQPDGIETLKVAEIFNITRILILPVIVLWLAIWYVRRESGAQQVNVGRIIVSKFPLFVLGFLVMFGLSSLGLFAPTAQHYQGTYFDNSEAALTKTVNGRTVSAKLTAAEAALLQNESTQVTQPDRLQALQRLIAARKLASAADDDVLRGLEQSKTLSKEANKILKAAHKAVHPIAKKIAMFRDLIAWFFTFGLVGLGMQITVAAMRQAGGQPLIIGSVIGLVKALGALAVVVVFPQLFE